MGFGGPIGLIVIGLVLSLAFNEREVGPLQVQTLGWILVLAGARVAGADDGAAEHQAPSHDHRHHD